MALPESVTKTAREYLTLPEGGANTTWLWQHAERVSRLAQMLALLPEAREVGGDQPDQAAVGLAALYVDAGWATQVRAGEIRVGDILNRPTNDLQRELSATVLQEHAEDKVPAETLALAVRAIRECSDRYTKLPEARTIWEAENLDDLGTMYVLRQLRQHVGDGRPLDQMVVSWSRQVEYHYWDARINDCLRWETTRHIARERLKSVEQFMLALARDLEASDLQRALSSAGIDASSIGPRNA